MSWGLQRPDPRRLAGTILRHWREFLDHYGLHQGVSASSSEIVMIMADPDIAMRIATAGADIPDTSRTHAAAYRRQGAKKYRKIIAATGG